MVVRQSSLPDLGRRRRREQQIVRCERIGAIIDITVVQAKAPQSCDTTVTATSDSGTSLLSAIATEIGSRHGGGREATRESFCKNPFGVRTQTVPFYG